MFFQKFQKTLNIESQNLLRWSSVLIGIGVLIYFQINIQISLLTTFFLIILFFLLSLATYLYAKWKPLFICITASLLLLVGYSSILFRVHYVRSPKIHQKYEKIWIEGMVDTLEERETTKRLILTDLTIKKIPKTETPKKIRINTKTTVTSIIVGDKVAFYGTLIPPPHEVIPDGFDFARFAYFKRIGAIGYTVSQIKILKKRESTYGNFIRRIRLSILEAIQKKVSQPSAGIAIALLVGDTTKIPQKEFEEIRTAGISHLLAISGMHITLVAGIFFFFIRFLLSRIQYIALRIDIKKIAAFIALLVTLFYLLIADAPVSAQRAFFMTAFVLIGVIIDRTIKPLRTISIAAIIILIMMPEAILSPSLQMSFSACLGLICGFNIIQKKVSHLINVKNRYFNKFLKYTISIMLATILATLSTTPFIAYHSIDFSTYSLISNLLIIPINDLIVMPCGILGVILMPIHAELLGFKPMELGIKAILFITKYINHLPEASIRMSKITDLSMFLFTTFGLLLILLKTNIKYIAFIFLGAAIYFSWIYKTPDILISQTGDTVAIKNGKEMYFLYSSQGERYTKKVWSKEFDIKDNLLKNKLLNGDFNSSCNTKFCIYQNDLIAIIVNDALDLDAKCKIKSDLFINLSYEQGYECKNTKLELSKIMLEENGAYAIWLQHKNTPILKSVSNYRTNKPWEN